MAFFFGSAITLVAAYDAAQISVAAPAPSIICTATGSDPSVNSHWCTQNCVGKTPPFCTPEYQKDCSCVFSCSLGYAYNRFQKKCEQVPTWNLGANEKETVCFDNTWTTENGAPAHGKSSYPTCVSMEAVDEGISFEFVAYNDNVQKNAYTKCDKDMFNHEVVEVFITNDTKSAKPEKYWEVELTPTGAVWFGKDNNPGGERANLTHVLYPCKDVTTKVEATDSQWNAKVTMPFSIIGTGNQYRLNFFRVQMDPKIWEPVNITKKQICGANNCTFACANCPTSDQPDFHHSGFFGFLNLKN